MKVSSLRKSRRHNPRSKISMWKALEYVAWNQGISILKFVWLSVSSHFLLLEFKQDIGKQKTNKMSPANTRPVQREEQLGCVHSSSLFKITDDATWILCTNVGESMNILAFSVWEAAFFLLAIYKLCPSR